MTRWVTFDCFGTLVNWRHGIATCASLVAPGQGERLLALFNRYEPEVQSESPAMRYRDVLAEALRRACAEAGIPLLDDDASVLAAGIPYWPVFPDTLAALGALRDAGWRLALLTNCDRDIIAETQRRLQVPIDAVITAEDVGAYKPAHAHFTRFQHSFDVTPDSWVHVAQSYFHDMVPTNQLGIPRIWINRLSEPDDPSITTAVLPNLDGLLPQVTKIVNSARRT